MDTIKFMYDHLVLIGWFCLLTFIGIWIVATWITGKIIQNVFCKHNEHTKETILLIFKHPNVRTGEVLLEKCARCKKVINETITKLR